MKVALREFTIQDVAFSFLEEADVQPGFYEKPSLNREGISVCAWL